MLIDEVTDISNIFQLVSFVKYYDYNKEKVETVFIDRLNLFEFSKNSSPKADAIVSCITEKFQELQIEISNLKAFVFDGASVMVGKKSEVATKLKTNFALKILNIHCICHRLALAWADTGDGYKFIRKVEEILIELWRFFKNPPKRLHIYMMVTLSAKEFDSFTEKKKKNYVKLLKKTFRTRWLSLHAGVDAAFGEYKGLIYTLKEIQNDKASGSTASGLLKKISHNEFLGTLYLLKNILPSLTGLSKTFQIGSLNFSRISSAINRCKSKIIEVAKDYRDIQQLKEDLNGRLKELNIILKESEEIRITNLVGKCVESIATILKQGLPKQHAKF